MKRKVEIHIKSLQTSLSPVLCGLEMLRAKKLIDLKYRFDKNLDFGMPQCDGWLMVDDKTKIFLDSDDRSIINKKEYDQCDYYLKRMITKADLAEHQKILPMGLNYVIDIRSLHFLKALFLTRNKTVIMSRLPHFFSGIASLFGKAHWSSAVPERQLYSRPNKNTVFKIIFFTRLFNDDRVPEINAERIDIIRKMKLAFKDRFVGGIADDKWGRKYAPDLVLTNVETNKKNYITSLNKFDIGISNQGLSKSIGWKMAEYTMKSMGILTHEINEFYIPGEYEENVNYLSYNNADELLAKADYLLTNADFLIYLKKNNEKYAAQYLHPELYFKDILFNIP